MTISRNVREAKSERPTWEPENRDTVKIEEIERTSAVGAEAELVHT
jgi:hypothetical protein